MKRHRLLQPTNFKNSYGKDQYCILHRTQKERIFLGLVTILFIADS